MLVWACFFCQQLRTAIQPESMLPQKRCTFLGQKTKGSSDSKENYGYAHGNHYPVAHSRSGVKSELFFSCVSNLEVRLFLL